MTFRDYTRILRPKWRRRPKQLTSTVVLGGLLSGGLWVGAGLIHGAGQNLEALARDAGLNRSIVAANTPGTRDIIFDQTYIDRAMTIFRAQLEKQHDLAKNSDINFATGAQPLPYKERKSSTATTRVLDLEQPSARAAVRELFQLSSYTRTLADEAAAYHPTYRYAGLVGFAPGPGNRYSLTPQNTKLQAESVGIFQYTLSALDANLIRPLYRLSSPESGTIPALIPIDDAAELAGLSPLPDSASSQTRSDRLAVLQKQVVGQKIILCYRNPAALKLVEQADNPPAGVIYQAASGCKLPTLIKDTRSPQAKAASSAAKQLSLLADPQTPQAQEITLQIVGFTTPPPGQSDSVIANLTTQLIGPVITTGGWVLEYQAAEAHPVFGGILADPLVLTSGLYQQFFEFASTQDMNDFLRSGGCADELCSSGKSTTLIAWGNPINRFNSLIHAYTTNAALIIAVFALTWVLLLIELTRRLANDFQIETNAFRILGASERQITNLYGVYGLGIGCLAAIVGLVLAGLVAWLSNAWLAPEVAAAASTAFNLAQAPTAQQIIRLSFIDGGIIALGLVILAGAGAWATAATWHGRRRNLL